MLDCSLDPLAGSDANYGLEWPKKRRDYEKKFLDLVPILAASFMGATGVDKPILRPRR